MKHFASCLILTLMLSMPAWAQKVTLQGTFKGVPDNINAIVMEAVGSKLVPRDTLHFDKNGRYKVDLAVPQPALFLIQLALPKQPSAHLMVEPADKNLVLDLEFLQQYNFIQVTNTKGSRNMEVYQRFNNALYTPIPEYVKINGELSMAGTSDARKQELSIQSQQLQLQQKLSIKQSLTIYSDCLMSAFLVTYFDNDFATYADLYELLYNNLKTTYANNVYVANLGQKVASSLGAGSLAPEIAMKDPDGNIRKLSALRGKVVLIDFWASWCSHCKKELPNVVRLYNKYHDKGFEIYSVSMDKDRNAWLQDIANFGQIWDNHVSDLQGWTSSGGKAYGISSIPSTVLVDPQGRIIAKNLRGQELANKLAEIFGE